MMVSRLAPLFLALAACGSFLRSGSSVPTQRPNIVRQPVERVTVTRVHAEEENVSFELYAEDGAICRIRRAGQTQDEFCLGQSAPNAPVLVRAAGEGTLLAEGVTDAEGRWSGSLSVPPSLDGVYFEVNQRRARPPHSSEFVAALHAAQAVAEQRLRAERAEAARAAGDSEIMEGRCSNINRMMLSDILDSTTAVFRSLPARRVGFDFLVVGESGERMSLRPVLDGTYHVLAVSRSPVSLEGHDAEGRAIQYRSEYETVVRRYDGGIQSVETSSLRVPSSGTEEFTLRVAGHGCVLVVGYDVL